MKCRYVQNGVLLLRGSSCYNDFTGLKRLLPIKRRRERQMQIDKNMIKAVIFDMDGVLFDTERLCKDAWAAAAEEAGLVNGPEDEKKLYDAVNHCIGLNGTDTKEYLCSVYGSGFSYEELHGLCSRNMSQMIERDGLPMKEGVRELLSYLKEAGYKIGLASSSRRESIESHLSRAGISAYFESIISGDMVEHSKPEPDIYRIACASLSVEPENAIAIEDSPNGLKSAYRAGMYPVMVPDMIAPTEETDKLIGGRKFDSLIQVRDWMKE